MLTQKDIDKVIPEKPVSRFKKIINWLDELPQGSKADNMLLLLTLTLFVAGSWVLLAYWNLIVSGVDH